MPGRRSLGALWLLGAACAPLPFAPPAPFPVAGELPLGLALGDFDGDGDLDIVTADARSGALTTLANAGGGTFTRAGVVSVGGFPDDVLAGDLNGDGALDLVVDTGGAVVVLRGDGLGGFSEETRLAEGLPVLAVALADFDRDGALDLAVASDEDVGSGFAAPDAVTVFLRRPTGFAAGPAISVGRTPAALLAADLDRDGAPELVAANADSDTISLLRVDAAGALAAETLGSGGARPVALAAADANLDGVPDLFVVNEDSDSLSVLYGFDFGDGFVGYTFELAAFALGRLPVDLAVVDLDGDAAPDVVSLDSLSRLTLAPNNRRGTAELFEAARELRLPDDGTGLGSAGAVAAGDLDGDGRPDLAVTYGNANPGGFNGVLVLLAR